MKIGDRAQLEINGKMHHCVVDIKSKGVYMFVNEDGEEVASIQLFWSTKSPSDGPLTGDDPGSKADCSAPRQSSKVTKRCYAPGCIVMHTVKRSDLARGWGRTCSKSCAAKLRELEKETI